jgi:Na+:H+ antiporter, NhaA family
MHAPPEPSSSILHRFLASEAAGGIVLMAVAALALIVANSPLQSVYFDVLKAHVLGLSILHWINDALMAVFFLLVGLEIKREILEGQLSTWARRALPGAAALGGMIVPALIYLAFNLNTPETLRGWAIPAATDIAFALGVLALLGSRVPVSLKIFLMALAILDDLGAVAIIAVFYTSGLDPVMLGAAGGTILALAALNRAGVTRLWVYVLLGVLLWFFVLRSGVHATLAGIALAIAVPLRLPNLEAGARPLIRLEHLLQPWVAFVVVPVFGFANAGVSFAAVDIATLLTPVPLGVAFGLFVGKQLGVSMFAWAAIKAGLAELPVNASARQFYGVAILCGIGFTMSLFIGLLAFPDSERLRDAVKIGVIAGSLLSAMTGAAVLARRT